MSVVFEYMNDYCYDDIDDDYYDSDYYYDDDYSYCEECDMIDSDDNWFWYDDDEYTDYLHIKCNKDKYSEQ